MSVTILQGDVRAMLATLPSDSVQCVVTSPPYWGLRDYGTAQWEGGDAACDHRPGRLAADRNEDRQTLGASYATHKTQLLAHGTKAVCDKCGAIKTDDQLGLEPTPAQHVAAMVDVFRAVRRVLRPDGVCWVNYGDSYAGSVNGRSAADTKAAGKDDRTFRDKPFSTAVGTLKPKDLCMVPARFALAMQDDGWWLRSMMPWVKRNGMPESTSDRPATAVEYVFLFSKSARYFYDADAVMRNLAAASVDRLSQDIDGQAGSSRANGGGKTNGPMKAVSRRRDTLSPKYDDDTNGSARRLNGSNPGSRLRGSRSGGDKQRGHSRRHAGFNDRWDLMSREEQSEGGRRFRNSDLFFDSLRGCYGLISDADGRPLALDVPPQPYREAHFATFPPKLIEPLIRAGTSDKGCCPRCGSGWRRITETTYHNVGNRSTNGPRSVANRHQTAGVARRLEKQVATVGWQPGCNCPDHAPVPCVVLDPFGGAGTTGVVASYLARDAILIELNRTYVALAEQRLASVSTPLFDGAST